MESTTRREVHPRRKWTLGVIMIVVACAAVLFAIARPFVTQPQPSGDVIGISFDLQVTRGPDGQPVFGYVPKTTTLKPSGGQLNPPTSP